MSLTQNGTETKGPDTAMWMFSYPVPEEQVSSCSYAVLQPAIEPMRVEGQGVKQNDSTSPEVAGRQ